MKKASRYQGIGAPRPESSIVDCRLSIRGIADCRLPIADWRTAGDLSNRQSRIDNRQSAFTLVEMLVVVSIVIVILALVVPAASTMWAERKNAEAVNTVQGLLMTTRTKALQSGGAETGFFAFLDAEGVQRVVTIAQLKDCVADPAMADVFAVTDDRDQVFPPPMRLVPRYVVDIVAPKGVDPRKPFDVFGDDELASEDFDNPPNNQAQRHRNFFTVVFSRTGEVLVNRDVLIRDVDADDDGLGDRTGLRVGPGDFNVMANATASLVNRCRATDKVAASTRTYFVREDTTAKEDSLFAPVGFLVIDGRNVALNFPSVDGPMVYDQSAFAAAGSPAEKREVLIRTAQPLYVSRFTGVVVRGPVGSNETP